MSLKDEKPVGVILMTMGDVESPSGVLPFLLRLFSDPFIIRAPAFVRYPLSVYISLKKYSTMLARYRAIGGGSPMNAITARQAEALQAKLCEDGNFRVYASNRYCPPDTEEAYRRIKRDGIKKLVALPLYPHYSTATTASNFAELAGLVEGDPDPPVVAWIKSFSSDPGYVGAFAAKVEEALGEFDEDEREDVEVIFSAHSLPQEFIDTGDPYVDEIRKTVEAVAAIVKPARYCLSFQSKGGGRRQWLKPEMDEVLEDMRSEGRDKALVVPVSFVAENIETLYDVDILYRKMAGSLGVKRFVRAKCPDTDPAFIDALALLVRSVV